MESQELESIRKLEAQIRVLSKRLARSEHHRSELEKMKDKDLLLHRRLHADLDAANKQILKTQDQLVQAEKMSSLGKLTAGIAHEIKNPLNFINNFAAILPETVEEIEELLPTAGQVLDPESQEELSDLLGDIKQSVTVILKHGERANGIVSGMMEHSKVQASKTEYTPLHPLITLYVDMVIADARTKHPDVDYLVTTEFSSDIEELELSPNLFGRALINILENAVYAVNEIIDGQGTSDAGYRPTISISTSVEDEYAHIRISDNGSGIDDEIISHVFDPFFTSKPTGAHTGLGLSLAHEIVVRGHSGMLSVDRSEEEGTSFIIKLPMTS